MSKVVSYGGELIKLQFTTKLEFNLNTPNLVITDCAISGESDTVQTVP